MPVTLPWRSPAGAWLLLALGAIGLSTVYAVGLVLTRVPAVRALFPLEQPFPTMLVLHVDFAAGAWFLAMAAVLWSLWLPRTLLHRSWLPVCLAGAGMLAMAAAPLMSGDSRPLLSDYMPVLDHPLFLAGAMAFLLGWGAQLALALPALLRGGSPGAPPEVVPALRWGALVALSALLLLAQAWLDAPAADWRDAYPALVWGPGHMLQTMHMLLALAAWTWLSRLAGREPAFPSAVALLPGLLALPALAVGLALPWFAAPAVPWGRTAYTGIMVWSGSVSLLGVAACALGRRSREAGQRPEGVVLDYSLLLYATGVAVGFLIRDDNSVVPAHYHGAIGGITLAYMGLSFRLLEWLGAASIGRRWMAAQARLYALGLLAMISGLVLAGVPRKTALPLAGVPGWVELAGYGLMILGGLGALAGSFMFIGLVGGSLRRMRWRRISAWAVQEGGLT